MSTRHNDETAATGPLRTVTTSDAVAAKRHRQPDVDVLRRARDAMSYSYGAGDLPDDTLEDLLVRLARAEQTLAAAASLPDVWEEQYSIPTMWPLRNAAEELRAALRASQGGQT